MLISDIEILELYEEPGAENPVTFGRRISEFTAIRCARLCIEKHAGYHSKDAKDAAFDCSKYIEKNA